MARMCMPMEAVETALLSEVYDVTGCSGFALGRVTLVGGRYVATYQGNRVDGSFETVEGACRALAWDRKYESSSTVNVTKASILWLI